MRTRNRWIRFTLPVMLVAGSVVCGAPSSAISQPAGMYAEAIDAGRSAVRSAMEDDRLTFPGAGVAVAVDGEIVWSEGFGLADMDHSVPVTRETRFGIGSISKVLTMALCGRLVDEGLLDLDTPVEKYMPGFPQEDRGITVRLLAAHLSGMDDGSSAALRYTMRHYDAPSEAEIMVEMAHKPLLHEPGAAAEYATVTYTVIATVVEAVAQKDFTSCMTRYVLEPLGLGNTVPNDPRIIIPNRTAFYRRGDDGEFLHEVCFDPSYKMAGAGYLSTAEDIARFGAALLRPGFLQQETVEDLFRTVKTTDGRDAYALGWSERVDSEERRIVEKTGGGPGIRSVITMYPDEDLVVVVLMNLSRAAARDGLRDAIAEAFLEAK